MLAPLLQLLHRDGHHLLLHLRNCLLPLPELVRVSNRLYQRNSHAEDAEQEQYRDKLRCILRIPYTKPIGLIPRPG
jgi:hypothetical protein